MWLGWLHNHPQTGSEIYLLVFHEKSPTAGRGSQLDSGGSYIRLRGRPRRHQPTEVSRSGAQCLQRVPTPISLPKQSCSKTKCDKNPVWRQRWTFFLFDCGFLKPRFPTAPWEMFQSFKFTEWLRAIWELSWAPQKWGTQNKWGTHHSEKIKALRSLWVPLNAELGISCFHCSLYGRMSQITVPEKPGFLTTWLKIRCQDPGISMTASCWIFWQSP